MKSLHQLFLGVAFAAMGLSSPAQASFGFTGLEITNGGTLPNDGTSVTTSPSPATISQPRIDSFATGENPTTGSTGVSQAFTAPGVAGNFVELTNIYLYCNTLVSSVSGWSLSIYSLPSLTGAQTPTLLSSTSVQPAGGGYTPLSAITVSGASGTAVKFSMGDANYIQLTSGNIYLFNIKTSSSNSLAPQTTSFTGSPGMTAGTYNGSTFTPGSGNFTFWVETVAVPEPSDWMVVPVLGAIALLGFRRWRGASL